MNVVLVVLICWVVFSAILLFCDAIHQIYFNSTLLFIFLTAPLTVPVLILAFPIAIIIRYARKLHFERIKLLFRKKKNYNGVR